MTENAPLIAGNLDVMIPSTGDDMFFDQLGTADLLNFSTVCLSAYRKVEAYKRRRFSIYRILDRFFDHADSVEFRYLMRSAGVIISGSCVLQLFDRAFYPESDLDIFVGRPEVARVAEWLTTHGYVFKLTTEQEESHQNYETLTDASASFDGVEDFFSTLATPYNYASFEVLNFVAKDRKQKIQIVCAVDSPLCMVLNFHSTVVFNIVTHSKAYCLYPKATLLERRNLLNNWRCSFSNRDHVVKYTNRGWTVQSGLTSSELFSPTSSFSSGLRRLGDNRCWTISFRSPAVNKAVDRQLNMKYPFEGVENDIELDAWICGDDGSRDFCNNAYVLYSKRLSRPYLLPTHLHLDAILNALDKIKRKYPCLRSVLQDTSSKSNLM